MHTSKKNTRPLILPWLDDSVKKYDSNDSYFWESVANVLTIFGVAKQISNLHINCKALVIFKHKYAL